MHKTLLAISVITASAFAIPALAQVNLGGAARVGAGANAGVGVPNAMHAAGQIGGQTDETVQHTTRTAKHALHKTASQAPTVSGSASARVNGGGAATTGTRGGSTAANAGVDADASVNAKADAHGH